jgi:hypothetical protein
MTFKSNIFVMNMVISFEVFMAVKHDNCGLAECAAGMA